MIEQLKTARSLVAAGWTQMALARNAEGYGTQVQSQTACQFCALGALGRAGCSELLHNEGAELLGFRTWVDLAIWNDDRARTQAQVVARFDEAIARLEGSA